MSKKNMNKCKVIIPLVLCSFCFSVWVTGKTCSAGEAAASAASEQHPEPAPTDNLLTDSPDAANTQAAGTDAAAGAGTAETGLANLDASESDTTGGYLPGLDIAALALAETDDPYGAAYNFEDIDMEAANMYSDSLQDSLVKDICDRFITAREANGEKWAFSIWYLGDQDATESGKAADGEASSESENAAAEASSENTGAAAEPATKETEQTEAAQTETEQNAQASSEQTQTEGLKEITAGLPPEAGAVQTAGAAASEQSVEPGTEALAAEAETEEMHAEPAPGTVPVGTEQVSNLHEYHGNVVMQSASVIKVFIMGAVYDRICYPSDPAQAIPWQDSYDGELRSLIEKMITVSDNECANRLVEILGQGDFTAGSRVVYEFCQSHGYMNTSLGRRFMDSNPTGDNYTSAADCRKILVDIYEGKLVNAEASEKMLTFLKGQNFRNKIPAGLPAGFSCGNKTGEMPAGYGFGCIENDMAIVFAPEGKEDYVLVVLSNELNGENTAAQGVISGISSYVAGLD